MARGMGSALSGTSFPARAIPGGKNSVPGNSNLGSGPIVLTGQSQQTQIRDSKGRFAGGWGVAWTGLERLNEVLAGKAFGLTMSGGIEARLNQLAQEMVAWAKENAPWEDRTTDAREGLQAKVVKTSETSFSIFLGHGANIHYGIFLETMDGGKYAILSRTILHFAPNMGKAVVGR